MNADLKPTDDVSKFMLQEHSRMIDVYQDLHVQKNELLKIYLAFASIPISIVAIFLSLYRYLNQSPGLQEVLKTLTSATVCLSILLVAVGFPVLMILLKIRGEQYLYVQTVNGTRKFFRELHNIDSTYLVLPDDPKMIFFAEDDPGGRPFWEAMIVIFTTSMLLSFLTWQACLLIASYPAELKKYSLLIAALIFVFSVTTMAIAVKRYLKKAMEKLGVNDSKSATQEDKKERSQAKAV